MNSDLAAHTSADVFPVYLSLLEDGKLAGRVAEAEAALHECHLCGNDCGIDRAARPGPCRVGDVAYVASYGPHHGEEDVLRGWRGSGTLFFSGCNLHCVYCQNCDISQHLTGEPVTPQTLASMMLDLQSRGCHNLNLVSPTHVVPQIVRGLAVAIQAGLRIPIVYNTGGYDAPQALRLMDGLVDIYLPDMKYAVAAVGWQLSGIRHYPQVNQAALREMYRQVGSLALDDRGLARRGVLVRHLVLPGGLAGTGEIARFLAEELSLDTAIHVMAQYRPAYRAADFPPLDQLLTRDEYAEAVAQVRAAGLTPF